MLIHKRIAWWTTFLKFLLQIVYSIKLLKISLKAWIKGFKDWKRPVRKLGSSVITWFTQINKINSAELLGYVSWPWVQCSWCYSMIQSFIYSFSVVGWLPLWPQSFTILCIQVLSLSFFQCPHTLTLDLSMWLLLDPDDTGPSTQTETWQMLV